MARDPRDGVRNPACTLCPLHESAEHVCLMGSGSIPSEIMVVGEAPGAREDEQHAAFVGPAGRLLTTLLKETGLAREEVYITNAAKCRPPANRTPTRLELKTCANEYLAQEIAFVRPSWILLLGNAALQAVVRKSGITKHRGKVFQLSEGLCAFGTFHPAAVLRNPQYEAIVRADFSRFARLIRGESSKITTKVKLIRTVKQLAALKRHLLSAKAVSFDIETYTEGSSNLEDWHGENSQVVSISFTTRVGTSFVVPLSHENSPFQKDPAKVLTYLKPALEGKETKYVGHNGKFDSRWLASKGIFVPLTFDTMLAAHMLDENRSKGLKPLSQVILGADAYDVGEDLSDARSMPLKRLAIYNGKDTDYTHRLYEIFREELKKEPRTARIFAKLMMPASNTLTKVERAGIYMDPERWRERTLAVEKKRRRIVKALMTTVPPDMPDFNFNSPQQVAKWLFEYRGNEVIEETPTGNASTKESVLLHLAQHDKAAAALLKYRKWAKYLSTYLLPWREYADRNSRIHPTYRLFGTVTGRLSCADPNLQQVPRDPTIRGVLGAAPGWILVEADYSQIELRIAAMLAGEKRMLRAFALGKDLHVETAVDISGKTEAEVLADNELRKKGKSSNFSLIYAVGVQKLIDYTWEKFQIKLSWEEAERIRSRFFEAYPRFHPWHDRQRRLVHRYQRVQSPLGRIRHLPDVQSSDKAVRAEAERQAINSPVQSCASDLMLVSMVELDRRLRASDARVVGSIHDALLFEVRPNVLDSVLPEIKGVMEDMDLVKKRFGADITVPIVADLKVGQHWGECDPWS